MWSLHTLIQNEPSVHYDGFVSSPSLGDHEFIEDLHECYGVDAHTILTPASHLELHHFPHVLTLHRSPALYKKRFKMQINFDR